MESIKSLLENEIPIPFRQEITKRFKKAYSDAYNDSIGKFNENIAKNIVGMLRWAHVHQAFADAAILFDDIEIHSRTIQPGNWNYTELRTKHFLIDVAHINKRYDFFTAKKYSFLSKKAEQNPDIQFYFDDSGVQVIDQIDLLTDDDVMFYIILTHGNGTFTDEGPSFIRLSLPNRDFSGFIDELDITAEKNDIFESTKPITKNNLIKIKKDINR